MYFAMILFLTEQVKVWQDYWWCAASAARITQTGQWCPKDK